MDNLGALAGAGWCHERAGSEFRNIFLMNGKAPDVALIVWPWRTGTKNNQSEFSSQVFSLVVSNRWELDAFGAKIPVKSSNRYIGCIIFFVGCSYIFRFIMKGSQ